MRVSRDAQDNLPSLLRKIGAVVHKEVNEVRQYETLYILRSDLEGEKTQELVERYKVLVTNHGGEIEDVNEWGKRRLAYEIDEKREGYYVLMKYQAATDFTSELERLFKINDDVLRYLTIRVDES